MNGNVYSENSFSCNSIVVFSCVTVIVGDVLSFNLCEIIKAEHCIPSCYLAWCGAHIDVLV